MGVKSWIFKAFPFVESHRLFQKCSNRKKEPFP